MMYNQNLIADYLMKCFISADRLVTSGGGESNPIADNNVRDGRMMNRRAELTVME